METALEAHNLTVSYTRLPVLWNVDFTIPSGTMCGILGPNGSGKTTLLKSIMDLLPPDLGYVKVFEKSIDSVRGRVSYVPQRESVDWNFPATVYDVVKSGRYGAKKLFKRLSKEDYLIIDEALERVKMTEFSNRQIGQLSGGQQQRVFLARALCRKADLFLLDEPFTGVDALSEETLIGVLQSLIKEGKTVVMVHHDIGSAVKYFDYAVLLNTRLIAAGKAEDVLTEENLAKAYGAKLSILDAVRQEMKNKGYSIHN
ncbi:metal ABC transporter ATP-binding protein [Luteibaculum oceani]|uniref:Metal ABC transporter ATP-binding protein n=1 Tax=Luteibaculum oceani TaxID=1294296 RepID=A0A5C6VB78_9FLAO|nr:metal ABC transporter ATP-binding protein [Luteibaculum oceani]TXC82164.1 metal ABC transporter ATP-binding protein [Luteibaculum oceani]